MEDWGLIWSSRGTVIVLTYRTQGVQNSSNNTLNMCVTVLGMRLTVGLIDK